MQGAAWHSRRAHHHISCASQPPPVLADAFARYQVILFSLILAWFILFTLPTFIVVSMSFNSLRVDREIGTTDNDRHAAGNEKLDVKNDSHENGNGSIASAIKTSETADKILDSGLSSNRLTHEIKSATPATPAAQPTNSQKNHLGTPSYYFTSFNILLHYFNSLSYERCVKFIFDI